MGRALQELSWQQDRTPTRASAVQLSPHTRRLSTHRAPGTAQAHDALTRHAMCPCVACARTTRGLPHAPRPSPSGHSLSARPTPHRAPQAHLAVAFRGVRPSPPPSSRLSPSRVFLPAMHEPDIAWPPHTPRTTRRAALGTQHSPRRPRDAPLTCRRARLRAFLSRAGHRTPPTAPKPFDTLKPTRRRPLTPHQRGWSARLTSAPRDPSGCDAARRRTA